MKNLLLIRGFWSSLPLTQIIERVYTPQEEAPTTPFFSFLSRLLMGPGPSIGHLLGLWGQHLSSQLYTILYSKFKINFTTWGHTKFQLHSRCNVAYTTSFGIWISRQNLGFELAINVRHPSEITILKHTRKIRVFVWIVAMEKKNGLSVWVCNEVCVFLPCRTPYITYKKKGAKLPTLPTKKGCQTSLITYKKKG